MIQLTRRLQQIADMVTPGARVADIGTDHGQLIAYLAVEGILSTGYACDINEKPLDKARRLLADLGRQDQVRCVLAGGLDGLEPGCVDTVVIAGMGGDLTARIVDAAPWLREYRTRLLLQPMTKSDHLREYLYRNGFQVEMENAVVSGRFVYTVFSAVYDGTVRELGLLERYIGRALEGNSPDTDRYLMRIRSNLRRRAAGIERSKTGDRTRQAEYLEVIGKLETLLKERGYDDDSWEDPSDPGSDGALSYTGEVGQ